MSTVRPARSDELVAVQTIGLRAGERFREIDDERIARCADDPPFALDELAALHTDGRLLVAVDEGRLVGFVVFEALDGCAHVEEVSVVPEAEGRGHGTALLDAVGAWGTQAGLDSVTLTTFAEVPWNRPYYERRGFRVLTDDEITPALRARRDAEAAQGLLPELRVVMRRDR